MIIRQIEVRNFKKLVEPLVIESLPDGLAILVGENEEGKSTLLQAIRSCFFDKHNMTGERAQSLQPYNSSVRPEVRVEFQLNGQSYKLFKAFCHKPQAELITPAGRMADAAAEEELARLLRFTPAQRVRRDASDREHEGIFGMFWVEQGKSFTGLNPTADGRSSIQHALQQEVGDVLGGRRGKKISDEVAKRRTELLTAGGKPRGEYAKAIEAVQKAKHELAGAEASIAEYESKLQDLERARARQKRYESEHAPEQAEGRLNSARQAATRIAKLRQTVTQAASALETAHAEQQLAANRSQQRARLVQEAEKGKREVEELKSGWDAKHRFLAEVRQRLESEEKVLRDKIQRLEQADAALAAASVAEQLARSQFELDNLLAQGHKALQAKGKVEKAREAAAAIRIEKKDISRLKHLQESVTKAQTELNALATNVRIDLDNGVKARIGRAAVVSGSEYRLMETTTIEIADLAKVKIMPGGEIGNPRAELAKAQEKLKTELAQLGVSGLAEADARLEERQNQLTEAKSAESIVEAHAPDGIDTLQVRIAEIRGELQRLTELAGGKPKPLKEAATAVADAKRTRDAAEQERMAAEKRAKVTSEEFSAARTAEAGANAGYQADAQRLRESEERLTNERAQVPDAELHKAVIAASDRVTSAEQTAAAANKELEDADPESVDLELRVAEDALNQLRKEMGDLAERVIRRESELRVTGAQGLGERKQQLEAEVESAKTALASFERQAKTIELLYSVLVEAERTAKETYLAPVSQRVQSYLKLLLPGAELRLNEDMEIVGLRRDQVVEDFQLLSLGTREQLAVLTRLAFADLLREKGQPAPVLLDDAIVYADDERFKRMVHILRKAAEKTQILVFTCHERDYEGSGAPLIRLADCRMRAGASSAADA